MAINGFSALLNNTKRLFGNRPNPHPSNSNSNMVWAPVDSWTYGLLGPPEVNSVDPHKIAKLRPEWKKATDMAVQSVGLLHQNNQFDAGYGTVVLISLDVALVPFHVIAGKCSQNLSVTFGAYETDTHCLIGHTYPIKSLLEYNDKLDYALVLIGSNERQRLPGHDFRVANLTTCPPSTTSMVAHCPGGGYIKISIAHTCDENGFALTYCSYVSTEGGSSGGGVFNNNGYLSAIHVSRSTGLCGGDVNERYALPLRQIIETNPCGILARRFERTWNPCLPVCTAPSNPVCVPPIKYTSSCTSREMFDTNNKQLLNLHDLNEALKNLKPSIAGIDLSMLGVPGINRNMMNIAVKTCQEHLYHGIKRQDVISLLKKLCNNLVETTQAEYIYDTHGDRHFPGGPPGTKFLSGKTVVNPKLEEIINPHIGQIRRDANGKEQSYYLTKSGIPECGNSNLTIQVDFNAATDTITYHGYPDNNVTKYVLSRTKTGPSINT
jgi:hypothetical protein